LREIALLSSEGLSLEGIRRVLALQEEVAHLTARLDELRRVSDSRALVVWRPQKKTS